MTIIFIPLNGIVWPFRVKYIMFEYNVTMAMTNTAKGEKISDVCRDLSSWRINYYSPTCTIPAARSGLHAVLVHSLSLTFLTPGLSSALTHIAGTLLGSLMSRRISTNMGYLRLILLTAFLSWLITPLLIYFGCDNKPVVGLNGQM